MFQLLFAPRFAPVLVCNTASSAAAAAGPIKRSTHGTQAHQRPQPAAQRFRQPQLNPTSTPIFARGAPRWEPAASRPPRRRTRCKLRIWTMRPRRLRRSRRSPPTDLFVPEAGVALDPPLIVCTCTARPSWCTRQESPNYHCVTCTAPPSWCTQTAHCVTCTVHPSWCTQVDQFLREESQRELNRL